MKYAFVLLRNTILSALSLVALPTLGQNTSYGTGALNSNTTGDLNAAFGYRTLFSNTAGSYNTAMGYIALYYNTTGSYNTALGKGVLFTNTTGGFNTASGHESLFSNITGSSNTANGFQALFTNTTGSYNTAHGYQPLAKNTTGSYNTADGVQSLFNNTTGAGNIAYGYQALYNSKGKYNIGLGYRGGFNITTGSNNIALGHLGVATDNGVIRIGTTGVQTATYIAGINGATTTGGVAVYIDANGQLGTVTSSRRFKNDIKSMGSVSDKLLKLRPVTFRYKQADEKGSHPLQYGLIAEEVAKVFPDLVQYDKQGKPFTIYYHLLTPMILNELQKANKKVESVQAGYRAVVAAQNAKIATLTAELAEQKRLITQLAAYVQKNKNNAPLQKVNIVQH